MGNKIDVKTIAIDIAFPIMFVFMEWGVGRSPKKKFAQRKYLIDFTYPNK